MNGNAITLIDVAGLSVLNTVMLDQVERGICEPVGRRVDRDDGRTLVVTHAGTHELSVIDVPGLLQKLGRLSQAVPGKASPLGYVVSQASADVPATCPSSWVCGSWFPWEATGLGRSPCTAAGRSSRTTSRKVSPWWIWRRDRSARSRCRSMRRGR